jgi:dienelactone hydrolase
MQIFGKNDNHVPPEGRDLIRKTLHDKGVLFSFYEVAWAQRGFPYSFSGSFRAEELLTDGT